LKITERVSYYRGVPRQTPPDRLQHVARAACRVFIKKGYRRALLADVGRDLGLSHAVLYRYVENKQALFELALIYATDPGALKGLTVPLRAPPEGRPLELVKAWATDHAQYPVLGAACGDNAADPVTELGGIIDECYAFVEHNRALLALIARSGLDIPELNDFFFHEVRASYIEQLTGYLRRRMAAGDLRPAPDAGVAARFIIESIAWFAWHRIGDPASETISDDQARVTVRDLLLAAFTPECALVRRSDAGDLRRIGWALASLSARGRRADPGRTGRAGRTERPGD
jgi:AcrR family transcriptional regulator